MFLAKDKKLLEAFRKGDRDAMDVVYRHYHRGVTAFLRNGFSFRSGTSYFFYRGIHDPKDLESAVQEVFKRAFEDRARHAYNGVTSFSNWILAIARNMVINQFRNREVALSSYVSPSDVRSHGAFLDDEVTEEYSGLIYGRPARAQDVQLEKAELKDLIDAFTAELSEDDRRLLVLRFAEGMGQEETARVLGSTRMRIRTAEARLRTRLRAFLRDSGYIDHMPLGRAPTPLPAEPTGSGAEVLDDNTVADGDKH